MAASTHVVNVDEDAVVAAVMAAPGSKTGAIDYLRYSGTACALFNLTKQFVMRLGIFILVLAVAITGNTRGAVTLPMGTVFKGQDRFEQLVVRAKAGNWKSLPIGERTATVGQAMVGTPYRFFTLEIDDRIESPSVNFTGLDCWTFFEIALAFARMLDEPETNWTPAQLLRYIEMDRYRRRGMHGRISLSPALPRRLALR